MARAKGWMQEFRDFVGSTISFPADYFAGWFGVAPSESGVEVNELTAMQIASFVGCVRVISGAIAVLPFRVWQVNDDGTETLAPDHILDDALNNQPNDETTAADFWQTVMVHLLLTGNSYAEKAYNNAGQPAALYLRSPSRTIPYRYGYNSSVPPALRGKLHYITNDTPDQYERVIPAEDMVHVRGLGMDSLVGLSPVKYYAREVLGCDLAAQSYSSKFFANDSRPGGYLTAPGFMSAEKKKAAVESWIGAHSRGNANSMALLDGGWDWKKVGVNPDEAQFLETRKFNREQIAAIFGVPVHLLGETVESRVDAEQRGIEFLTFTVKVWIAKIEQVINARMFPKVGRHARRFHARMDTTMFDRPTFADLLKGIQIGRYAGLYTTNEARKLLGEQPYSQEQHDSKDPADKLWMPVNMIVVSEDMDPPGPAEPPGKGQLGEGQGGDDQDGGDGGAKPASGTTQGGQRDAEIKRYFALFYPTFRDALGRILARKKADAGDFKRAFGPVLTQIASAYSFRIDSEPGDMTLSSSSVAFIRDYINFLAARGTAWTADKADSIASEELLRALRILREKCSIQEEEEESDARSTEEKAQHEEA